MTMAEIITAIKDIILACAAIFTACIAFSGVEKWQKELRGKANFDVARGLLKAVYKLRNELSYCRSPFIPASEFPEAFKGRLAATSQERADAYAYIYSNRWKPVGEAAKDFEAAILEAEALWGVGITEKAHELRQCVISLNVDIDAFISNEYSDGEHFKDQEFAKKIRSSVSDMKPKENELTQRINAAIEGLESELRPHLVRY